MSFYITITEAAYLMGFSEEIVLKMIEKGELLCKKGNVPVLIHESEMSRFQHPWKHICRLEQRINAQQNLVETLKSRVPMRETGFDVQVNNVEYLLNELRGEVNSMKDGLAKIMEKLPALIETVDALQSKQKRKPCKVNKE
jgi:uncharacterized coiled-coil protein SlyX